MRHYPQRNGSLCPVIPCSSLAQFALDIHVVKEYQEAGQ